jgi:hypothetical protein
MRHIIICMNTCCNIKREERAGFFHQSASSWTKKRATQNKCIFRRWATYIYQSFLYPYLFLLREACYPYLICWRPKILALASGVLAEPRRSTESFFGPPTWSLPLYYWKHAYINQMTIWYDQKEKSDCRLIFDSWHDWKVANERSMGAWIGSWPFFFRWIYNTSMTQGIEDRPAICGRTSICSSHSKKKLKRNPRSWYRLMEEPARHGLWADTIVVWVGTSDL